MTNVLENGLVVGMRPVGDRFEGGESFIADLLIASRAMTATMDLSMGVASWEDGATSDNQ